MKKNFLFIFFIVFLLIILAFWVFVSNVSNEQKIKTYKADEFEIKYPDWSELDFKAIFESEKLELAVAKQECSFLIHTASVPKGVAFREHIQKLFQERAKKLMIKITSEDIRDNNAFFDGEIEQGKDALRSIFYSYFTSRNDTYIISFIAEKSKFTKACMPYLPDIITSVDVR